MTTQTLKPTKKGQKKITFQKGGLHQSLGVPSGVPIPRGEFKAALSGKRGVKAQKQAQFKKNLLTGSKKKRKSK